VAGRYAAGLISYVADNRIWWGRGGGSFLESYGDPYYGNCSGSRPVFCTPLEGDKVNLSAVAVTPDGTVWFASGILFNEPDDVNYGLAAHTPRKGFTYYDPVRDAGLAEANVSDLVALPDGRLVLAGPSTGVSMWNPATGKHVSIRAGQGIPDDPRAALAAGHHGQSARAQVATRGRRSVAHHSLGGRAGRTVARHESVAQFPPAPAQRGAPVLPTREHGCARITGWFQLSGENLDRSFSG
jgi:hypothetical protein